MAILHTDVLARMRYVELIKLIDLPPRKPRGHRENMKRAKVVAAAFHQIGVAMHGGKCRRAKRGRGCPLCRLKVFKPGVSIQP